MNTGVHPIDSHVGARIRLARRQTGITQQVLGDKLGITFQQVQKYERGANRISASKLFEAAEALNKPVAWFFEGLTAASQPAHDPHLENLLGSEDVISLAQLWPAMSGAVRVGLLNLMRSTAAANSRPA